MDPSIASLLAVVFAIAASIAAFETKAALKPPSCAQCLHCQALARAKAQQQQALNEWYARRWNLPDRDDDDRRP
jgi:hypothetical protein